MIIEDLDILRPEPHFLRLAGKDIDVSFIPCAITFDVDKYFSEIARISQKDIESDIMKAKEAFDLSIKLCVLFCEHSYPEMNETWFRDNVDAYQIKAFTTAIREALLRSYQGVGEPKNAPAPKSKKKK